jgi:hypothetical protein
MLKPWTFFHSGNGQEIARNRTPRLQRRNVTEQRFTANTVDIRPAFATFQTLALTMSFLVDIPLQKNVLGQTTAFLKAPLYLHFIRQSKLMKLSLFLKDFGIISTTWLVMQLSMLLTNEMGL